MQALNIFFSSFFQVRVYIERLFKPLNALAGSGWCFIIKRPYFIMIREKSKHFNDERIKRPQNIKHI